MFNAIVLAGRQAIKNSNDAANKALLKINGKMMVQYVMEAILHADGVRRIVVVGPEDDLLKVKETLPEENAYRFVPSDGKVIENLVEAIKYLQSDNGNGKEAGKAGSGEQYPVLISTSDIPLITPQVVNAFVQDCVKTGADICYPIISKKTNMECFPEFERTYVELKDGVYTGGNMFFARPDSVLKKAELAERLSQSRKHPLQMAAILGMGLGIRFILRQLTVASIIKRFEKVTGLRGAAIFSNYPEIGNDVDKPSDILIAAAYLD